MCVSRATQLALQPALGHRPVPLDRARRDGHGLGGFFNRQSTEVAQFDDAGLLWVEFLQTDVTPSKRKVTGLQAVFKEVFPITSYDEKVTLDFARADKTGLPPNPFKKPDFLPPDAVDRLWAWRSSTGITINSTCRQRDCRQAP